MPVWKRAIGLAVDIFSITADLPRAEDYSLTSQLRRSANSVSANISEGFGREKKNDKCYFYTVSKGSSCETQSHLIYGEKVGYFDRDEVGKIYSGYDELIHELNKLIKSLRRKGQG